MSDEKDGPLGKDTIEKPLDAAKQLLISRLDYRTMAHKECDAHFAKIQKIMINEFYKENPDLRISEKNPEIDLENIPLEIKADFEVE